MQTLDQCITASVEKSVRDLSVILNSGRAFVLQIHNGSISSRDPEITAILTRPSQEFPEAQASKFSETPLAFQAKVNATIYKALSDMGYLSNEQAMFAEQGTDLIFGDVKQGDLCAIVTVQDPRYANDLKRELRR